MNQHSFLIITSNLFKIGCDNEVSIFIVDDLVSPVEITFNIQVGENVFPIKTMGEPGKTRKVTLTLPKECPVGAGVLTVTGKGGLQFEEKRDIIVYDNRHAILVQTSASTYRPLDTMEIRVVATNENFIPIEYVELNIQIYVNISLFLFLLRNLYCNCRMLHINLLVNFHMFPFVMVNLYFHKKFFFDLI
jgi:hypothetical protein